MKRKLLSIVLCVALLASFVTAFSTAIYAKTAYSNAAVSLVVNILNPDGTTTQVHEYTGVIAGSYTVYNPDTGQNVTYNYYSYPELENFATLNYYASIDAMPAAVGTRALGVTITDLVNDARQYNPDLKWEPGQSIRMYPTDAAGYPYQGNNFYNYDFVQGQTRYYYPNLVESYTEYRANGEDTSYLTDALINPVPVEPMFCIATYQERYATDEMLKTFTTGEYTFKPNDNEADWRTITTPVQMDSKSAISFCMGLTPAEAQQGINNNYSSTNKFCKWIYQIDIGPMKGPSLTADRTSNNLGQPISITYNDLAAWRSAITGVIVDGVTINSEHYTITAGVITFDETVFTNEGSHAVIVTASGYLNTEVVQAIESEASVAVTGITLNKTSETLAVGSIEQLTATVNPGNATNKDVTWSSNNEAVVTVNNGSVTALSAGTATITATTVDGGKKATCIITVSSSLKSITLTGLTSSKSLQLNGDGIAQSSSQITTTDGKITLDISQGTKLLTAGSTILSTIKADVIDLPPDPPTGTALLLAYEFRPDGATFDPALNLSAKYGELPDGTDAETVRIVYWNGDGWKNLSSTVNPATGLVTAEISHFSRYAVVVDMVSTARFILSDLNIVPATVNPGETVSVQATITNQGEIAGSHNIRFVVDNAEVDNQLIQLEPGQDRLLSFDVKRNEPGEYVVSINEKMGKFVVIAPDTDENSPDSSTQVSIRWIMIGVIAVAGIGIGTAVSLAMVLMRRKTG
jgi:uncharacterized protein YjdB